MHADDKGDPGDGCSRRIQRAVEESAASPSSALEVKRSRLFSRSASARRRGEARDQRAEPSAPDSLGVEWLAHAAPLESGEPLAQRMELERRVDHGLLPQEPGVIEARDALAEDCPR